MAEAGFTHAAGADIPHSATSRRGMLPALAGLVVGLAYAAISVYWAVGGRWPLNTVGISLSQPGQAGHLATLLAVWGAAAVKAVAAWHAYLWDPWFLIWGIFVFLALWRSQAGRARPYRY